MSGGDDVPDRGPMPGGDRPTGGDPSAGDLDVAADTEGGGGRAAQGRARGGGGRKGRRRPPRWVRLALTVTGLVVVLVVAVVIWYQIEANPSGPPGRGVVVSVADGEPTSTVVQRLAAAGVIDSALAFRVGEIFGGTPVVQPGSYLFHAHQSFSAVRDVLAGGPDVFAVDVLPGYTLAEVAARVDELPGHATGAFAAATKSGAVTSPWSPPGSTNLEGLLGTGWYQVLPGESDTELLADMVRRFDVSAAAAGLTTASAAALGMTPYQVIITASIVQKEGYYTKNMGQVARVIYNRVASGTPLQMDSTVLYSLGQDGGTVTPHDLTLQTPYNTYLNHGLTPTPICMPSVAALRAAVSPTPGSWRYFVVVDKNGDEAFADTYAEQQANEQLAASRGVP